MEEEVEKAQKIMLSILVEFERICSKYQLTYWLDYGTLLGAVRHKGFIPWDDDLDVSMPREDYEKFLQVATKELGTSYFLQNKTTDKDIFIHFSKIRDINSFFVEKHEVNKKISYKQGIYIDIFPINYIDSSFINRIKYTLLKTITKIFSNRYISIDYISKPLIKRTNSYHGNEYSYMVRGAEKMSNELKIDKKYIFPLQECIFENLSFKIPSNSTKYLKLLYGDTYMVIPPVNLRKRHSSTIYFNANKQKGTS